MKLRDYQQYAVDKVLGAFAKPGASVLGVAATGLGKTVIFCHVAKERAARGRVLIIAHRQELIAQAAAKVRAITGIMPAIEMGDLRSDETSLYRAAPIVVASKDSLIHRMDRIKWEHFDTLITDEAHHAIADRYRRIYARIREINPSIRHFGVTATPDRADEIGLKAVYDSVAFEFDIKWGIEHGWLCNVFASAVEVTDLDFSGVRKARTGDLSADDLDHLMRREGIVHKMAVPIHDMAKWRSVLIFCTSIAHAELMTEVLQRVRNERTGHTTRCAAIVTGKTPDEERKQVLKDFAEKRIQFLCNVGVLTEGYDDPGIDVVAMCRPTLSRSLYTQMVGRGTRPLPGLVDTIESPSARRDAIKTSRKKHIEVIDFVGNSGQHKLINVADALAGDEPEPIINRAAEIMRERGTMPAAEAIEEARREAEERRQKEHQARHKFQNVVGKVQYTVGTVDPFDILNVEPLRTRGWDVNDAPTEAQKRALEKHRIKAGPDMTRRQASQLLDAIIDRRNRGLCSYRQAKLLQSHGYDTTNMTFDEASRLIQPLMQKFRRKAGAT